VQTYHSSKPASNKVQRVFQVGAFKARQEAVTGKRQSVEEIAKQWNSHVTVSSGETITAAFMQAAVLIWDFLLKRDSSRSLIVEAPKTIPIRLAAADVFFGSVGAACFKSRPQAEEAFGKKTPWDSVYKLEHLLRKTLRDIEKTNWVLMCINDLMLHNNILSSELSIAALSGKGKSDGRKGSSCPTFVIAQHLCKPRNPVAEQSLHHSP